MNEHTQRDAEAGDGASGPLTRAQRNAMLGIDACAAQRTRARLDLEDAEYRLHESVRAAVSAGVDRGIVRRAAHLTRKKMAQVLTDIDEPPAHLKR